MKTIKNDVMNEIVIKNSRFICCLKYVDNEEKIESYLKEISLKYKDATHITYAFKLANKQKYFDDGEPSGTAGAPIMEVLIKNDLVNVLAVVIRYFGGIKLGAGGLIRAYSKACREALKLTIVENYILYNYYEIKSNYDDLKLLNSLTKSLEIIEKNFSDEIIYKIRIEKEKDNINELFISTNIKTKKLENI
ncbi:MAG: IMPACT family protein [Bacilli bacterium]